MHSGLEHRFDAKIAQVERRLSLRLGTMLGVSVGLLAALVKLL